MIKALGRNGDLPGAFAALDELANTKGLGLERNSLNHIMQACVYDNATGFRHAVMLWWRMRAMRMRPDIITYNMLLRCTLECGAGDTLLLEKLLRDLTVDPASVKRVQPIKKKAALNQEVMSPSEGGLLTDKNVLTEHSKES